MHTVGWIVKNATHILQQSMTIRRVCKMKHIKDNPVVAIAGEWFTAHGKGFSLGYFGKRENCAIAEKLKKVFAEWINNGHTDFDDENTIILRVELTDGLLLSHGTRYEF